VRRALARVARCKAQAYEQELHDRVRLAVVLCFHRIVPAAGSSCFQELCPLRAQFASQQDARVPLFV